LPKYYANKHELIPSHTYQNKKNLKKTTHTHKVYKTNNFPQNYSMFLLQICYHFFNHCAFWSFKTCLRTWHTL